MQETSRVPPDSARTIRFADLPATGVAAVANGIEDIYNDKLDVIVIRNAFPAAPLAAAGESLDRDDRNPGWARPNEKMPIEDIQLLGTDTPATPTYQAPRGASLESYLESASRHRLSTDNVFGSGFKPAEEVQNVLAKFSGGRPVKVARSVDGRSYVPVTIRRLVDGKQIGLHHDYHYSLALYSELSRQVDTRTLVSFVVTLRPPETGGELFVYAVTPDTPNPPKLANGFSWDLEGVEQRFHSARFVMGVGDLFLLASGRCLHRVGRVAGGRARVTMGGFLALDKSLDQVWYWS